MLFDFAQAKADARRAVQETFGVQAYYSDDSVDAPIEFRARWHNRISKAFGGLVDGDGYAEVIEGIDRIVFFPKDVDGYPFTAKRGGEVTFPSIAGVTFVLDHREPSTGPLEEAWVVTRKSP